jgi:hypothetical protein
MSWFATVDVVKDSWKYGSPAQPPLSQPSALVCAQAMPYMVRDAHQDSRSTMLNFDTLLHFSLPENHSKRHADLPK